MTEHGVAQEPVEMPTQEIEDTIVTKAHVGRQVAVCEPGKPEWIGFIRGWDYNGVVVGAAPEGPYTETIAADKLRWVM